MPKFVSGNDIKVIDKPCKSIVTMLCPAQAYPVPVFR